MSLVALDYLIVNEIASSLRHAYIHSGRELSKWEDRAPVEIPRIRPSVAAGEKGSANEAAVAQSSVIYVPAFERLCLCSPYLSGRDCLLLVAKAHPRCGSW